jgi:hypothetical protein
MLYLVLLLLWLVLILRWRGIFTPIYLCTKAHNLKSEKRRSIQGRLFRRIVRKQRRCPTIAIGQKPWLRHLRLLHEQKKHELLQLRRAGTISDAQLDQLMREQELRYRVDCIWATIVAPYEAVIAPSTTWTGRLFLKLTAPWYDPRGRWKDPETDIRHPENAQDDSTKNVDHDR